MQYLCNKHGLDQFYPTDPGERAMVDSAMFYLIGTLYPLLARATYPTLGFPQYAGEVGDVRRRRRDEGEGAAGRRGGARRAARRLPRVLPRRAGSSSAATRPSIADIRFAATLEFLRAIDYDFPAWAEEYMARDGDDAGRGLLGAGGGRARLHRLREVAAGIARTPTRSGARRAPISAGALRSPVSDLRRGRRPSCSRRASSRTGSRRSPLPEA